MKLTIAVFLFVGAAFLLAAYLTGQSKNTDTANSAIVPQIIGIGAFAIAAALTVGFGLFRLFTS